jgi:CRP/FNR family cyclic AMP-dependent transcriptional regulator
MVAADMLPERPEKFWNLLDEPDQASLEQVGRRLAHPAGTILLAEGDRAESVLVLMAGRVKVISVGARGHQSLLAIRTPGDVLGELAAVDERVRSATVVTLEPIQVLRIPVRTFVEILTTTPRVTYSLLRVVSTKLRTANLRRLQSGDLTVAQRVAMTIAELAADHGRPGAAEVTIALPISQEDLARMVGASREAVVRALRELRDDGIIRTERQNLTLLRSDLLELRVRAQRG